jgi:MFS transporter, OFA family, oxalate/formate antiporter
MRRWPVVVGALLVQVCLGAIYAWGTFVPMLKAGKGELALMLRPEVLGIDPALHADLTARGKTFKKALAESRGTERDVAKAAWGKFLKDEVEPALNVPDSVWNKHLASYKAVQAKSIFSTGLLVFSFVMIFSGRWQDRAGPRFVALGGCTLLGVSYLIASLRVMDFWWVWFWVGVVGGVGIGCAYVCPIAACLKWYPEKKGLITGLAVAGFGAGAYLFINLAGAWAGLLAKGGISLAFQTFGVIFIVVGGLGSLLLSNPPEGLIKAGPARSNLSEPTHEYTQAESLRTSTFWLLWWAFLLSAGSGLMVISSLKDFAVAEGGMNEASAEQALGLLALFNGLGRIVWGTAGQFFGPRRAAIALMLLQSGMLATLPSLGSGISMLALAGCWVGFHFGGNLSLFPLMTAERFGMKHLGGNYGLVFTGYGMGGVVGPLLAGSAWDNLHSYRMAFLAGSGACVLAAMLVSRARGKA